MSLKKIAFSGIVWTTFQQFSVQFINFGVQIILARLLLPEMFGLIAMIQIFIAVGQTLMDSGMTSSLIRTQNPDQDDYSTVFYTNIFMSILIYILIFIFAPLVATFYKQPVLSDLLRIYSLSFVIKSFVGVQTTRLTKDMNFKLQMYMQIPSTIVGGIVGILLAINGFGVWSLVWLNLVQSFVFMIQHWFFTKWRPSFSFDKEKLRTHFKFGIRLTASSLLDTLYNNSYTIVIGKAFSPSLVGFYNQADNLRLFPVNQISTALGKVTYPLFSMIQEDDLRLKSVYKKLMQVVLLFVIPIMLILIGTAHPLFRFVLGEKWLPSVPIFQILCLASIIRPVSTYNLNILKVKGRTDLFLKIEVIKKIIGVAILIVSLRFGLMAMVWSLSLSSILFLVINGIYSGKLINYGVTEQIRDISPLFLYGLISYLAMFTFNKFVPIILPDSLRVLIDSIVFIIPYTILCLCFHRGIIGDIKGLIKR